MDNLETPNDTDQKTVMRKLHGMVLRMFPGPFFAALGLFMFLILMQFLMQSLSRLVGKGLDFWVVIELIAYNLAYMFTLAVPMSVLVATLITFSKLIENKAWMVVRNAGVSLLQLMWPLLLVGATISGGMWYFANEVLPVALYRSSGLWLDITAKKPDFLLEPGKFFNGLRGYTLFVRQKAIWSGELQGLWVYDYTKGMRAQAILSAEKGYLKSLPENKMRLTLVNGELNRFQLDGEGRYERIRFGRYETVLDINELVFKRENKEGIRSDRTMKSSQILRITDSLRTRADVARWNQRRDILQGANLSQKAHESPVRLAIHPEDTTHTAPAQRWVLRRLSPKLTQQVYESAIQSALRKTADQSEEPRIASFEKDRINQFIVEVYKKRTMALASLVFILLGAPLGLLIRRGGLGAVTAVSGLVFLVFWIGMVNGEKLADRGLLPPIIIWASMILYVTLALILMARHQFGRLGIPIRRYLPTLPRFRSPFKTKKTNI